MSLVEQESDDCSLVVEDVMTERFSTQERLNDTVSNFIQASQLSMKEKYDR